MIYYPLFETLTSKFNFTNFDMPISSHSLTKVYRVWKSIP